MLLVLNGLPGAARQRAVRTTTTGDLLGIPDLLYLKPLLGIEYDGSYHREAGDVRQADLIRENRLVTHGLPLLRYCSYHLGAGQATGSRRGQPSPPPYPLTTLSPSSPRRVG